MARSNFKWGKGKAYEACPKGPDNNLFTMEQLSAIVKVMDDYFGYNRDNENHRLELVTCFLQRFNGYLDHIGRKLNEENLQKMFIACSRLNYDITQIIVKPMK